MTKRIPLIDSNLFFIIVSGRTHNFKYLISPLYIHIIIKLFSGIIVLFSGFAVWKQRKTFSKGLSYSLFLILAMILPQYNIFYTWSWIFVLYFSIFNYISFPEVSTRRKRIMLFLVYISFLSFCLISFHSLNYRSLIFWTTMLLWSGTAAAAMEN